jgi:hypothetical protein
MSGCANRRGRSSFYLVASLHTAGELAVCRNFFLLLMDVARRVLGLAPSPRKIAGF